MPFPLRRPLHCVRPCAALALLVPALGWCEPPPDAALGSLTFVQAEQLLQERGPDLQAARIALEGAQADVVTAREAPNPQLSVNSASVNFHDGIGSGAPWDKRIDSIIRLDQPLERGGKRRLRSHAAVAGEAASAASLGDTLRTSRLALAQAYYDLKREQDAHEIAAGLVKLQAQSLDAARLRLKAGDISSVDVARLEIELARAQADLADSVTSRRDAQIALALLLGLSGDSTGLVAADDWPSYQEVSTGEASIEERADVRAAQARYSQAEAALELARAQRTRDITVGLQYERDPLPPASPNLWGVGFSVPLFVRNQYEGEIGRAAADRRSAEQQLERIKLAALADRDQATAELAGAAVRLKEFQDHVVHQAQAAAQAAEYAYSHGALSLTDVLDARRAMQAIILDALDARSSYAKAMAAWRAAFERTP